MEPGTPEPSGISPILGAGSTPRKFSPMGMGGKKKDGRDTEKGKRIYIGQKNLVAEGEVLGENCRPYKLSRGEKYLRAAETD